ncbi:MAG: hypothetical protein ABJE47_26000, partial [bacterium]
PSVQFSPVNLRNFTPVLTDLGGKAWFERLRRASGNFAFGIQRIEDSGALKAMRRLCGPPV